MLDSAYFRIWRPGPDPNYVTDRHFSPYLTEDCDGYAACENRLRAILSKAEKSSAELDDCFPGVYSALKRAAFELQEYSGQILKASGLKTVRFVPPAHFALLEEPMALSQYTCRARLLGEDLTLTPFGQLTEGRLGEWYLERAGVLPSFGSHPEATIRNLAAATAAVRCLLYAQFGPLSETALSPSRKKGDGQGYFTSKSLFELTPPSWPKEEWYGFAFSPKHPVPLKPYPFRSSI